MAHFAKINKQNIVEQVIVAEQEFIDSGVLGDKDFWLKTSYNTKEGKHISGGTPFRKNYAGIGYTYDRERDAFIPPQPFPSFTLNEGTCLWEPPTPYPMDGEFYIWSEANKEWVKPE